MGVYLFIPKKHTVVDHNEVLQVNYRRRKKLSLIAKIPSGVK
jgi:hypothetical protein